MFEEKLAELEPVFYPKSIAVVGVSADERKMGSVWVKGLLSSGFTGHVYAVGSSGGTVSGLSILPNLRLVPEEVDYVIVSIPRQSVMEFLHDCAAKGVKVVQFFTAGFSETGQQEWREAEERMVNEARQYGIRIIGPNCIGAYCPEGTLPYGPSNRVGISGSVGFLSQSGGIGDKLVNIGIARHIDYSRGVSFGNGVDLDASDFLQYLATDPKTTVIGAYLEGTRDGRRLFDTIQQVTTIKPVVVWKGGRTGPGAQAATSHTGSMASSAGIWSAMLKQAGAVGVNSLEELTDTLLLFQHLNRWQGSNVAIVGGLADGGGGISVSGGDVCAENGLRLPPLSGKTKEQLTGVLGEVGSILQNPVDVSQARSHSNLFQAIELVMDDPIVDLVILQEDVDVLLEYRSREGVEEVNRFLIELKERQEKPIVVVLPPGSAEPERLDVEQNLLETSIPVFPSMERAARAVANVNEFGPR